MQSKPLNVAIDINFAPYSYLNQQGQPQGLIVEYWKLWEEEQQITVNFQLVDTTHIIDESTLQLSDIYTGSLIRFIPREDRENLFAPFIRNMQLYKVRHYNQNQINNDIGVVSESLNTVQLKALGLRYDNVVSYQTLPQLLNAAKLHKVTAIYADTNQIHALDLHYNNYLIHGAALINNDSLLFVGAVNSSKNNARSFISISSRRRDELVEKYNPPDISTVITELEREWLTNNEMTVVVSEHWYPYSFLTRQNELIGYHLDMMSFIGENLDIKFTVKTYDNWQQALKMTTQGDYDHLMGVTPTPSRSADFNFSSVYLYRPAEVFSLQDSENINGIEDINGRTIAVLAGDTLLNYVKERFPQAKLLLVKNDEAVAQSVIDGNADAGILVSESISSRHHDVFKVLEQVSVSGSELAVGTTKSNIVAASIMKKGVDSLSASQRELLFDKWLSEPSLHSLFNKQELSFIRQNPVLAIGSERWPSLIHQNNNSFSGASAAIFNTLSNMIGIDFVLLNDEHSVLLDALSKKGVDLIASPSSYTKNNEDGVSKQHYLSIGLSLYVNSPSVAKDISGLTGLAIAIDSNLFNALPQDVKSRDVQWRVVDNIQQAVSLSTVGKVDGVLASPALLGTDENDVFSSLKKHKLDMLPEVDFSLISNNSDSVLQSILQKALVYIQRRNQSNSHNVEVDTVNIIARKEPVPFYSENDVVKGLSHDLLQSVFRSADINIQEYTMAKSDIRQEFRDNDKYDVMAMIDMNDDDYFYSDAIIRYSDVVVSRVERNFLIQELADLKGKSVIAWDGANKALGDEYYAMFSPENRPDDYQELEDQRRQLELLIANKVDAIVIDETILLWYINQIDPDILSQLKIDYIISKPVPRYIAFKERELRDKFNKKFKVFKDSGKYQAEVRRYTHGAIRTQLRITDLIANIVSHALKDQDITTLKILGTSFENSDFIDALKISDKFNNTVFWGQKTSQSQRQSSSIVVLNSQGSEQVGMLEVWFSPLKLSSAVASGQAIPELNKFRHLPNFSFYQSVYRRLGLAKQKIRFSEQELQFIAQSAPIKYTDTNWQPLIFNDDGAHQGIVVDYLALIARKTGLKFEYTPSKTWAEAKQKFIHGEVDILPSTGDDESTIGLQTNPYAKFNFAIVKQQQNGYIGSIKDIEKERVVVIEGFTPASFIEKQYPHIDLHFAPSAVKALSMVERGEADVFVGHAAVAWHYVVNQFPTLKVVGITDNNYAHRIMVQSDNTLLFDILAKAVDDMDYDETALIRNKWVDKSRAVRTDYTLIFNIILGFSLMLLIGYFFMRQLLMKNQLIEKTNHRLNSTIDDLTQMQQALTSKTKALQEQKENFESLFSDATLGSLLIQSGRIVDCNNALITLLDYEDKNDLLFLSIDDFSPSEQPNGVNSTQQVIQYLKQCLNDGTVSFEWLLLTRKKTLLWSNVVLTKMRMNNSDVIHVVVSDISDRKTLEQEILTHNLALQSTNKELEKSLADLNTAQSQLIESEKLASLGELVAGVAHEINTPVGVGMTGISHFCRITQDINERYSQKIMSKKDFENYLEQAANVATLVLRNLERTAQLVSSFKQVSVDQTSEERRQFDIKEYVNEILISLSNILKNTTLDIRVNCADDLMIHSYPGAFSQILSNLIINSNIHGYPNKESGVINIDITVDKQTLFLTYQDDGKGIPEKSLPKIFDPFYTTNRENGGSGLGLNIIYNIITSQLNGVVKCESTYGEGATFLISYPIELIR